MGLTAVRAGKIARWAFGEPRWFGVAGLGGRTALRLLEGRVRWVPSPRQADVLAVAGELTDTMVGALRRAYAAMPLPRVAVLIGTRDQAAGIPFALTAEIDDIERLAGDVPRALVSPVAFEGLSTDPAEAGGGMEDMPAGRPMAGTGPDPYDDLWLDRHTLTLGPLHPALPHGLEVRLTLQGDRVVDAEVGSMGWIAGQDTSPDDALFRAALASGRARVADLERARAASHLWWAVSMARLVGQEAHASRLILGLRLLERDVLQRAYERTRSTLRSMERGGFLQRRLRGVGRLNPATLRDAAVTGPVARASGMDDDVRRSMKPYVDLAFHPVTHRGCDAWARWCVRTREVLTSIELADRAGVAVVDVDERIEGPRGVVAGRRADWRSLLPGVLIGVTIDEAVDAVASLDLDPETAA